MSPESPGGLRRELFSDHDDVPIKRPVKRRRILKIHNFSDEESEGPTVLATTPALVDKLERAAGPGSVMPSVPCSASKDLKNTSAEPNDDQMDATGHLGESLVETDTFDFFSMQYSNHDDPESDERNAAVVPASKLRRKARQKLGVLDADGKVVGQEESGWCEKHPWTTNIRDAKKRTPDDPNYDKTTLYIPPGELTDKGRGAKRGLTPFQRQFWAIKKANYDVIIFFKKGKFYELYDIDADIGHQQLGLNFTKGGRVDMRCCGVPEQSFDRHCARLIDLGYKVGRVEQTETANAAEKRKNSGGSNQSSVCERSLVRILTKATVTDDGLLRDHRARYVLALVEEEVLPTLFAYDEGTSVEAGSVTNQQTASRNFGVCYVDVASGSINIGQYDDDFRLAKTERLMTFLRPHEIILDLSAANQRLVSIVKWAGNSNEAEIIDTSCRKGFSDMSESWLSTYLNSNNCRHKQEEFSRVRSHLEAYPLCRRVFGAMASHLRSLLIDKETLSLGNYNLFPGLSPTTDMGNACHPGQSTALPLGQVRHLRMDAPTMQNLEVLSSCVEGSERGTLLSFIDHARTPAGRRLLRKWIAEPLVLSSEIEDRLQAVEDIHRLEDATRGAVTKDVVKQLKTKKDLERALPKLHQQATVDNVAVMFDDSNKRRVRDFIVVLRSLQDCLCALDAFGDAIEGISPKSRRLQWLYSSGCGVPDEAAGKLDYFLGTAFDLEAAEVSGEILPNRGAVPSYDACRIMLDKAEDELSRELKKWKKNLGDNSIKFYHRGKEPFQLEVKVGTLLGKTPHEFEVVSESKSVKRFYTRRIRTLIRQHVEASETHEAASSSVARDMIRQFDREYNTWSAISSACAEIDALIGLAFASRDKGSGTMCRPTVLPNDHPDAVFNADGLRHPILAAESKGFVSNDVRLGGGTDSEVMILTGPNAGGKSTLARQVALSVILAQVGCFVPAKSFCIRPFEDIYVRMGANDDLARGRSTFMVEMEEVGHILNNANTRSLIIADEVGRGTSTHDGYAVAYASLRHIATVNKSLTVFSTHYSHLGDDIIALGSKNGNLKASLFEMSAVIDEASKKITFLYKLRQGSSGDSRGIYCARVAGISESIACIAEGASLSFDDSLGFRLASTKFQKIGFGLDADDEKAVQTLQVQ